MRLGFYACGMRRAAEQDRYELEVLARLARVVASAARLDDLLFEIARSVGEVLEVDDCVVYVWDGDLRELSQRAAWGPKLDPETLRVVNPLRIPLDKGIVGWAASTRLVQIVDDVTVDRRYIPDILGAGSELAVPILHQDRLIGVIDAESPDPRSFGPEEAVILTRIADFSAPSIVQLERREIEARAMAEALREAEFKLRHVTSHDPLTGLLDRPHFEEQLGASLASEASDAPTLAVVRLGLDRFGQVNRAAGAAAADELLRRVASLIRDRIRRGDSAARLAGVEFALLLRGMLREEAIVFSQSLVTEIESLPLPAGLEPLRAFSGITVGGSGDGVEQLLERADRARRAAESEGTRVASV